MMNRGGLKEQSKPLRAANQAGVNLVKTELEAALTFCRLAQQSEALRAPRFIESARKAYACALRYMFKLDMSSHEFHQITADSERLGFLLEALESRSNGRASGVAIRKRIA